MLTTLICCALFFQRDAASMLDELRLSHPEKVRAMSESERSNTDLQQRAIQQRFQKMVDALQRFAEEYNKGGGHIWPLKEAEAVRKAYHNLERSMYPFAPASPSHGRSDPPSDTD
jgi:hypothetical protein